LVKISELKISIYNYTANTLAVGDKSFKIFSKNLIIPPRKIIGICDFWRLAGVTSLIFIYEIKSKEDVVEEI